MLNNPWSKFSSPSSYGEELMVNVRRCFIPIGSLLATCRALLDACIQAAWPRADTKLQHASSV